MIESPQPPVLLARRLPQSLGVSVADASPAASVKALGDIAAAMQLLAAVAAAPPRPHQIPGRGLVHLDVTTPPGRPPRRAVAWRLRLDCWKRNTRPVHGRIGLGSASSTRLALSQSISACRQLSPRCRRITASPGESACPNAVTGLESSLVDLVTPFVGGSLPHERVLGSRGVVRSRQRSPVLGHGCSDVRPRRLLLSHGAVLADCGRGDSGTALERASSKRYLSRCDGASQSVRGGIGRCSVPCRGARGLWLSSNCALSSKRAGC